MTKRNYLVFFIITALIFTMCSVSVFAEEGEANTLATAPDSTEQTETTGDSAADDATAEDTATDSNASGDDAVSSDDTATDDTAASDDESEKSDTATDDTSEGKTETATGTEEEHDHDHEEGTKKKGLSTTAIVLLAVFGAIILIFAVLYLLKPNFRERVKKFFREYKSELKKVVWSSKSDVIKNTKIVIIGIVAIAVVVGLVDIGLAKLIDLIGQIGK